MHRIPLAPMPPHSAPGTGSEPSEAGIPVSAALSVLMGVGFLTIGIVQGIDILRAEDLVGASAVIDGVGFFLLAGTGVTMLMNRFYSLYLLLLWAVIGLVGSFIGEGGAALPALFARLMVALVALAAIGQRGARGRSSGGS